jgi:hypothetical protein
MADEQVAESTDNQSDSSEVVDSAAEATAETDAVETKDTGATTETEKPEFSDPNMQKQYTKRMQEISEKEKTYERGLQKAQAWEQLMSDPEASKMVIDLFQRRQSGATQDEPVEPVTEQDIDRIIDNRDTKALEGLVDKRAVGLAKKEFMPVIQKLQAKIQNLQGKQDSMLMEQDLTDFANAKDDKGSLKHPDFWDEGVQSKMKAHLSRLKGSGMSGLEQVDTAYLLSTRSNLERKAIEKAHATVASKKAAVGEKGTKVPTIPNTKGKSLKEYARIAAKMHGIDEIP